MERRNLNTSIEREKMAEFRWTHLNTKTVNVYRSQENEPCESEMHRTKVLLPNKSEVE